MDIVLQTHQVTNQSPIYTIDRNLYEEDPLLQSWVNEATNHIKPKSCKKNQRVFNNLWSILG